MKLRSVQIISGKGSRPDQFSQALRGIAVDRSGLIYAVGDQEVKVFDAQGRLQRRWPTAMASWSLAFDVQGDVYVGQNGQVERFDTSGNLRGTVHDPGRLGRVTSMALLDEQMLLADATNRCIRRYDLTGHWLNDIGARGARGFIIPNGHLDFSVDARGIIHAVNSAKHRVERYTVDGKLLGHFGRFGQRAEEFPGCCNPTNLALAPSGEVVVTEKAAPRLKVYDAAGKLLALVGAEAFDPTCKNMDVAVDSRGRIYVADTVRLCITVFEKMGQESFAPGTRRADPAQGS